MTIPVEKEREATLSGLRHLVTLMYNVYKIILGCIMPRSHLSLFFICTT